ncbi:hypothetical protein LEWO105114_01775 [Legionella worsleiensis]|uniref:Uncharacterized protein n=1 Tax=Legionella worsleiensis TaxID=45076 RepID=A0A0W1AKM5_9GAMM|nr:hypothetical protein Lwor_0219 [Legionella worsleiensis]STY31240.1 Uncharacterised protein [Legionella worsleiensis]
MFLTNDECIDLIVIAQIFTIICMRCIGEKRKLDRLSNEFKKSVTPQGIPSAARNDLGSYKNHLIILL